MDLNGVKKFVEENPTTISEFEKLIDHKSSSCSSSTQTEKRSVQLRKRANALYNKKTFSEARSLYTQSIKAAPFLSEAESLAYGNRSAVSFEMNNYEDCLMDIENAAPHDIERYRKLLSRKSLSLIRLSQIYKASQVQTEVVTMTNYTSEEAVEQQAQLTYRRLQERLTVMSGKPLDPGSISLLDQPEHGMEVYKGPHTSLPSASGVLRLESSQSKGRFIKVGGEVPVGSVLIRERPYTHVLLPDYWSSHCYHCLTHKCSNIPVFCRKRSCGVIYCSTICESVGWSRYHQYECSLLPVIVNTGIGHLAYRIVTQTGYRSLLNYRASLTGEESFPPQTRETSFCQTGKRSPPSQTGEKLPPPQTREEPSFPQPGKELSSPQPREEPSSPQNEEKSSTTQSREKLCPQSKEELSLPQTGEESSSPQSGEESSSPQSGEELSPHQPVEKTSSLQDGEGSCSPQTGEESLPPQTGEELSPSQTECRSDYDAVYHLVTNEDRILPADMYYYSKTAVLLLLCALKSGVFSEDEAVEIRDERALYIGSLLVRHICQLICNAHAITIVTCVGETEAPVTQEDQTKLATAIYPTASLLNHSCRPNISVSFVGSQLLVKNTIDLLDGDQVYNCYGPHYLKMSRSQRLELLESQYYFRCDCEACQNNVPEPYALHKAFRCVSCDGAAIISHGTTAQCTLCSTTYDARSQVESVTSARRMMDQYSNAAHPADGIAVARRCYSALQKAVYKYSMDLANVKDMEAKHHAAIGNSEASARCLLESISILEEVYSSDSVELAHEYLKLSEVLSNAGNTSRALRYAVKARAIFSRQYSTEHSRVTELDDLIGQIDSLNVTDILQP